MNIPSPIFVGYFPKITAQKNDLKTEKGDIWLKNEIVEEICSVSDCISKGPEGWIDEWKHNVLGFYDTEESALSVIPDNQEKYDLFAYKLYPIQFNEGKIVDYNVESNAIESLGSYKFIGFDIVSKSEVDFFECSPLSCNNACEKYSVNKYCLIAQLENAYNACVEIEQGRWEPGPYYLFEVFRKTR